MPPLPGPSPSTVPFFFLKHFVGRNSSLRDIFGCYGRYLIGDSISSPKPWPTAPTPPFFPGFFADMDRVQEPVSVTCGKGFLHFWGPATSGVFQVRLLGFCRTFLLCRSESRWINQFSYVPTQWSRLRGSNQLATPQFRWAFRLFFVCPILSIFPDFLCEFVSATFLRSYSASVVKSPPILVLTFIFTTRAISKPFFDSLSACHQRCSSRVGDFPRYRLFQFGLFLLFFETIFFARCDISFLF